MEHYPSSIVSETKKKKEATFGGLLHSIYSNQTHSHTVSLCFENGNYAYLWISLEVFLLVA